MVSATDSSDCFHCGEPIPSGLSLEARIRGQSRPVCCRGCLAVAELIASSGLDRFYQFREGHSKRPDPVQENRWLTWDRDVLLNQVSQVQPEGRRELLIGVENIHCAACAWLIERLLKPLPGVDEVEVNAATATLRAVWDPQRTPLSNLFTRLDQAGYVPQPQSQQSDGRQRERRAALKRLGVAGLGMMQVMMYAVALYAGAFQGIDAGIERLLRYVSLVIATPVVLYSGFSFFRGAWRDIKAMRPGMDVPVALAIGAAFSASVVNTLRGTGDVYFDSATMFVFFLSVARYLEMHARHRSQSVADGIAGALPDLAERVIESPAAQSDTHSEWVTPAELNAGDRVRLAGGDAVPADGRIVHGSASVSEALLSGESAPLSRSAGDTLRAGSTLLSGQCEIEVSAVGGETLLAQIGRLLSRARSQRPPVAALADRIARWFVAGVLVIAALVAIIWLQRDPGRSFEIVLATLVVTCPCALSLATPAALAAATAGLARQGILIVSGDAMESLARVTTLVADKTGTLTDATPRLSATQVIGDVPQSRCHELAAGLERGSRHPLARAFESHAAANPDRPPATEPGAGVEGVFNNQRWRLGRPDWVGELAEKSGDANEPDSEQCQGTWLALGNQQGVQCWFLVSSNLRPQAMASLDALRGMGLSLEIASGDAPRAVRRVAHSLGIDHYQSRMSPEAKFERLRELQASGHSVAMVGDGINDAPVLGGADVAIAVGGAAALARSGADVVLLGRSLAPLAWCIRHGRKARRVIRQNLLWALLYNLVAVPLAAAGMIAPWMAAAGMSLSSLLVVANAIRLQDVQKRPQRTEA